MKEIYFIRHSKPIELYNDCNGESLQQKNEKRILSEQGRKIAYNKFSNDEFKDIEEVYSSHYARAIETAKFIAGKNNVKVQIVKEFGERIIGINSWNEYPSDFEEHQFNDNDYKLPNGESLNEVRHRELKALNYIFNNSHAKRIAIIFHATAMMALLKEWCDVNYNSNYYFHGEKFFDGKWDYCETFKLSFDNNNLISIINI